MKRGLVIGKFMPIHLGHVALIEFAANQCDELIVSMSYAEQDAIPPALRFSWIQRIFSQRAMILPAMVHDDFDDESLPLQQRTHRWAEFIKRRYPPIQVVFSSEAYGLPLAEHLGATHNAFDPERKQHPVSGTQVRLHPFQFWEYIPGVVRPYFVKKICFYGPESTGKSTLAQRVAAHYRTEFVPEVAREMITSNDFNVDDIIRIGHAQVERINEKLTTANKILCCDTDTITTQIYSRHYLNVIPEVLYELEAKVHYDLYFLMDIDVAWIADGLRDLDTRRVQMMSIFRAELDRRNIPYALINGSYAAREESIRARIDLLLQ